MVFDLDYARIDFREYPVVLIKIRPINPHTEQIDEFKNLIKKEILDRSGPFVTISDTEEAVFLNKEAKTGLAAFGNESPVLFSGRQKCSIIIVKTDVVRIMMKGVAFFMPKNYPEQVVGSMKEAREHGYKVLREHNMTVSD